MTYATTYGVATGALPTGGRMLIINPGSGPVVDATEEQAAANIPHLLVDCKLQHVNVVRVPEQDYGKGRYAFLLWDDNRCTVVQMPGLSLERVRYMDSANQNIWDFPRLYVDGSSWVWMYALSSVTDALLPQEQGR